MEDTLIVFIIFGCIVAVVKMILEYAKERARLKVPSSSDSSLTSSELQQLMRAAVEEVIDDRMGELERKLEKMKEPRLIPAGKEVDELEKPVAKPVTGDRNTFS